MANSIWNGYYVYWTFYVHKYTSHMSSKLIVTMDYKLQLLLHLLNIIPQKPKPKIDGLFQNVLHI